MALELDGDAVGVVGDKAGEVLVMCEAVDEGAEADALDDAADDNGAASDCWDCLDIGLG